MDSGQWYYAQGEHQLGPVSREAFQELAGSDQVDATTLVWREGMAEWTPAGQVQGLLGGETVVKRHATRAGTTRGRRSRITAVNVSYDREDWNEPDRPRGMPGLVIGAAVVDLIAAGLSAFFGFGFLTVADLYADQGLPQWLVDNMWNYGLLFEVLAAGYLGLGILLLMRWSSARVLQILMSVITAVYPMWLFSVRGGGDPEQEEAVSMMLLGGLAACYLLPLVLVLPRSVAEWLRSKGSAGRAGGYARRTRTGRRVIQ